MRDGRRVEPQAVKERIRVAFERLAGEYAAGGGLDLPVSVKLASGRKAG